MENSLTWWQVVIAVAGAFGGLEGVKWLFNRKTDSRIALAQAESTEFHTLQETNDWLQKQLQLKEERFAEQTQLVRKQNIEILELYKEKAALELELAQKKCEDMECPFRRPPCALTPPKPGISKTDYHQQKNDKEQ